MNDKKHLIKEGLDKIVSLKAILNTGLTNILKNYFTIEELTRLSHNVDSIPNLYWLLGFIQGEACFFISIYKSPKSKLGEALQLVFKITQHTRDLKLMEKIKEFLGCGRVEVRSTSGCDYTLTSSFDILFKKLNFNLLLGLKLLDYNDFYKVYLLKKDKKHLTKKGLDVIKNIKMEMSNRRANKE